MCVTVVYSGLWDCKSNWCCCCCFIQNSLETLLEYRIVASLDLRSRCDVILVCFLTLWCAAGLAFTCKLFKYIFTPDTVVLRERLQAPAKNMCRNEKWTMFWFIFHPKVRNNSIFPPLILSVEWPPVDMCVLRWNCDDWMFIWNIIGYSKLIVVTFM